MLASERAIDDADLIRVTGSREVLGHPRSRFMRALEVPFIVWTFSLVRQIVLGFGLSSGPMTRTTPPHFLKVGSCQPYQERLEHGNPLSSSNKNRINHSYLPLVASLLSEREMVGNELQCLSSSMS